MLLSVNKVGNLISGVIGTKRYSVPYELSLFYALQEQEQLFEMATTVEEAEQVIADAVNLTKRNVVKEVEENTSGIHYNEETQTFHLKEGDQISEQAVPELLAKIMIKMFEEGNTIQPLVRAWTLFLRNPNFTPEKAELFARYITTTAIDNDDYQEYLAQGYSHQKAEELATYSDVSITKQGLLVTNKYVRRVSECDQLYSKEYNRNKELDVVNQEVKAEDINLLPPLMGETGAPLIVGGELTHLVKVGKVHSLPSWSFVNCNDRAFAVKGAHLGGKRYIASYEGKSSILLDCLVSPDKIGAFDCSGNGAVRVLEYMVLGANFAKNKGLYHTTDYASRIEEEWASTRLLAIEESNAIIAKLKNAQLVINDLLSKAEGGTLSVQEKNAVLTSLGDLSGDLDINVNKPTFDFGIYADPDDDESNECNMSDYKEDEDPEEVTSCDNCGAETEGDWQELCYACEESKLKTLSSLDMGDYDLTIPKYTRVTEGGIEDKVMKFFKDVNADQAHNFESFCTFLENDSDYDEGVFIDELELVDLLEAYYEWELAQ